MLDEMVLLVRNAALRSNEFFISSTLFCSDFVAFSFDNPSVAMQDANNWPNAGTTEAKANNYTIQLHCISIRVFVKLNNFFSKINIVTIVSILYEKGKTV